jgi:hypothetical protein
MEKIPNDVIQHHILPCLPIPDLANLNLVNHHFNSVVSNSHLWKTLCHWNTLETLQRQALDAWYLRNSHQDGDDIDDDDDEDDPRPNLPTVGLDDKITICRQNNWSHLFHHYTTLKLVLTAKAFNFLLIMSGSALLHYPN